MPDVVTNSPVVDLRLNEQGMLCGSVLDAAGRPQADQIVLLHQQNATLAQARTDARGQFAFPHVRSGIYQVTATSGTALCRVWTHEAAPPLARDSLKLADGSTVMRGQQPLYCLFTNPWVLGALIAAAVAIPIAVHEAQDDSSP
jgi:hypothetical protein